MHHILPARRQIAQHRRDRRINPGKGSQQQTVVLWFAVGRSRARRRVQVGYRRGWQVRIGREEEGALAFGGGVYCLVEGAAGALGEEEVSLGEV